MRSLLHMKKLALVLAVLAGTSAATVACVHERSRTVKRTSTYGDKKTGKVVKKNTGNESLQLSNIAEPQGAISDYGETPQNAPDAPREEVTTDKKKLNCERIVTLLSTSFKDLRSLRAATPLPATSYMNQAADLNPARCAYGVERSSIMNTLTKAVSEQSGKIGLLLPLTGPDTLVGTQILAGMKYFATSVGFAFDEKVIVRDIGTMPTKAETFLAELMFDHQIGLLIVAGGVPELTKLASWSTRVFMPMIFLTSRSEQSILAKDVYRVFPTEYSLAEAITQGVVAREFKRIGVLRPNNQQSAQMLDALRANFAAKNVTVTDEAFYQEGDYESMEKAARKLFNVLPGQRQNEYAALTQEMKKAAKKAGYGFNQNMVVLPPKPNFDALFIPDDFKTLRHFAKIFKYLGTKDLPIFGNHQWRSKALVQPYDEFFENAFFVDFVGSYRDLPPGMPVATTGSPYFVSAHQAKNYDFNLIGYRGIQIAVGALANAKSRRDIGPQLKQLNLAPNSYFVNGQAFDEHQLSRWPAFLFEVRDKEIVPMDLTRKIEPKPIETGREQSSR